MLVFLVTGHVVCPRLQDSSRTTVTDDAFLGWDQVHRLSEWPTSNYGSKNNRSEKYGPGLASTPDDQRRVCLVRRDCSGKEGYRGAKGISCGASLGGVRQSHSPWLHAGSE